MIVYKLLSLQYLIVFILQIPFFDVVVTEVISKRYQKRSCFVKFRFFPVLIQQSFRSFGNISRCDLLRGNPPWAVDSPWCTCQSHEIKLATNLRCKRLFSIKCMTRVTREAISGQGKTTRIATQEGLVFIYKQISQRIKKSQGANNNSISNQICMNA